MDNTEKGMEVCTKKPLPNHRLRQARERCGWTQREVADALGVTELAVGRWERGERRPQRYYWGRLCRVFGASALELGLLPDPTLTTEAT